ncbi:acyl-CoA N-acyltransferase [Xylariaceae sp. FL0016]|nr:acyl-CoA N-acyltransferase [Xylariaceae sp. FL0016]
MYYLPGYHLSLSPDYLSTTMASQTPDPPIPSPIFTTDKVIVRPYHPSDASAMAALANDPEVTKTLRDRFPKPYTLEAAKEWIAHCLSLSPQLNFVIMTSSGTIIGAIGLEPSRGDIYSRAQELGYWLGKDYWGGGYASSAAHGFVRWAFAEFPQLLRIEATSFQGNLGSEKVLTRAGFVKEGIRRQAIVKAGEVKDETIFGIIRSDLGD